MILGALRGGRGSGNSLANRRQGALVFSREQNLSKRGVESVETKGEREGLNLLLRSGRGRGASGSKNPALDMESAGSDSGGSRNRGGGWGHGRSGWK